MWTDVAREIGQTSAEISEAETSTRSRRNEPNRPRFEASETSFDVCQSGLNQWLFSTQVVAAHRGGGLESFSSLLATLAPARPPRWDARCVVCAAVNEGFPDARFCARCGTRSPDVPLF